VKLAATSSGKKSGGGAKPTQPAAGIGDFQDPFLKK
jgi:hypothetical protein